ncbi:MAG: type II secretion system F family protein [Candidatus Mcinerneyibacterium aminivorans]|uniref:Type II secretion system F family protein n=1 Tax=Candidatus Mcinerneyibacterium aminivorans TaxID=2703815 RepID=A0A5D0MNK9_9BACT|nr:MAG: type II secretion system F family protein [Candidatus Mcinerneyibacterium aminivorans]
MPIYKYSGRINNQKTEGEIEAENEEVARDLLNSKNIEIETLFKKPKELNFTLGSGVKTKDIVIFTRQFSTMLEAGIPLDECLDILSTQVENQHLANIVKEVKIDVEGGKPLNESLAQHPKVFKTLYTSLVEAGEEGGLLTNVLNRLSTYMEKNEETKSKIKSAMIYPVIILIIAFTVTFGLLYFVIPKFQEMFSSFDSELPGLTQILIDTSQFAQKNFLLIIGAVIGFIVVFIVLSKTEKGRWIIDSLQLKLPIIGNLARKGAVARFTRTFGTLIESGVEILRALEITAKVAGNVVIEKAILDARQSISGGSEISKPLAESGVFPPMVIHMIGAGEKSGALEEMLTKIADFYEKEVDNALEAFTSSLEPILIVFIGGILGTIVIGMFMPILTMASAVG